MPYKGPGFYNEMGVRVCSLHPESLQEFVDSLGYAYVPDKKEFNELPTGDIIWNNEDIIGQQEEILSEEKWGGTN